MFKNYERVTDRTEEHIHCTNRKRYLEDCYYSADYVKYLTKTLSEFENALKDGLLVELTPERVLAVMACVFATSTNDKVKSKTSKYVQFEQTSTGGELKNVKQIDFRRAAEVLSDMVKPQLDTQKAGDKT